MSELGFLSAVRLGRGHSAHVPGEAFVVDDPRPTSRPRSYRTSSGHVFSTETGGASEHSQIGSEGRGPPDAVRATLAA